MFLAGMYFFLVESPILLGQYWMGYINFPPYTWTWRYVVTKNDQYHRKAESQETLADNVSN